MSATFTATVVAALSALVGTAEPAGGPAPGVASIMAAAMATIFVVAAVTKLRSPDTTAAEFTRLRLPAGPVLARVLPPIELATAALILIRPQAGAVVATGLLMAFTAVLIATIRSGLVVSCGCLGSVSRKPVTPATVARNLVFVAMTAMAASTPSLVIPDLASVMVSATAAVVIVLVLQLMTLRQELGRLWSVELAGEAGPRITEPVNRRSTGS